ncbi:Maf family protein [Spongiibacter tropicus]|uniref:Maf family protein n=1 Tax=Spongiibacter tropicus TaxID=454602 RepID=UPI0035BE3F5B
MNLILASASPRRAELLDQLGVSYRVCPADIDETPRSGEPPGRYVARMAREKAAASTLSDGAIVLAADTAIALDGDILGKPEDRDDARAMLWRLSGRRHEVITSVALRGAGQLLAEQVVTAVWFGELSERRISAYLDTGEADDKAGSYGIQGRGAQFVARIDGSYSGVVGLPLYETAGLLRTLGMMVE